MITGSINRYGFLTIGYRPKYLYWEILSMIKRTALVFIADVLGIIALDC